MIGGFLMSNAGWLHCRIMLQGQSNCYGVGPVSEIVALGDGLRALYDAPFSRVFVPNAAGTAYEPLQMGVNNSAVTAHFGCEFGLAVRWMRETTRGNLYIDKQYIDGSEIANFQDGAGPGFITSLRSLRTTLNAWLVTQGIRVRDVGWLWIQGEADYTRAAPYYFNQLELLAGSLTSGSPLPMPATAKRILAAQLSGSSGYSTYPDEGRVAYLAAHPSVTRIINYSNNFNADQVHLNAKGQVQLAYDAYEQFFNKPHLTA